MRNNISSGVKWENIFGYSRGVKIGNQMEISGSVATSDNGVVGKGDYYLQTIFIIENVKTILEKNGFSIEDVVRTRIFVVDINYSHEVGRAHREFFSLIKPATTLVEVSALIEPDYLVEMEFSAIKI